MVLTSALLNGIIAQTKGLYFDVVPNTIKNHFEYGLDQMYERKVFL